MLFSLFDFMPLTLYLMPSFAVIDTIFMPFAAAASMPLFFMSLMPFHATLVACWVTLNFHYRVDIFQAFAITLRFRFDALSISLRFRWRHAFAGDTLITPTALRHAILLIAFDATLNVCCAFIAFAGCPLYRISSPLLSPYFFIFSLHFFFADMLLRLFTICPYFAIFFSFDFLLLSIAVRLSLMFRSLSFRLYYAIVSLADLLQAYAFAITLPTC